MVTRFRQHHYFQLKKLKSAFEVSLHAVCGTIYTYTHTEDKKEKGTGI